MPETVEELQREIARLRARVAELEPDQLAPNLRLIASQIPDNIMLLDRNERIQFINWTVPDLTVEQVVGTEPYAYIPETHRDEVRRCYRAVLAGGEPTRIEMHYLAEDGSASKWETRVVPWRHGGAVDGIIVVSTNVTARDEAAADRDRFFALTRDLLSVATMDGYFKRVSPAFTRALGWSEQELYARPLLDFVHPQDLDATRAVLASLRDDAEAADFDNRLQCRDGSHRAFQWRVIAPPGERVLYAAARDVTDRRALEAQLLQAQKMKAVGQLAGGVAHDFNNLLLTILMNADLARKAATDAEQRTLIDQVIEGARRAATLTRQLLTFSRNEPLVVDAVSINDVAASMLEMLRRTLPGTITIALVKDDDLPPIRADAGQIEQVVLNLCINARDALPEGGRITIETSLQEVDDAFRAARPWAADEAYVRLAVSDDGVGIPAAVRERIFEPFFSTKPVGEGSGLGLAMVYGIAQHHRGAIDVHSEFGIGTTFEVFLPIAARPTGHATGADPTSAVAVGGSETILVAEDSVAVRKVVVAVLESAGYRVLAADDGAQAVSLVKQHRDAIDLVVLDVVMPKMSGPEAAMHIRQLCPALPILYTSGYSDPKIVGKTAYAGMLQKPYLSDVLLRQIRAVLDARR